MEDPTLAYEDMLFFERRLTEVVAGMQPKARRWRIVLLLAFIFTSYSAYFWITLWESLMKHPLFTISLVLLMFLFLICGVHKRVVAPKIVADRCRTVLSDFCLSCDEQQWASNGAVEWTRETNQRSTRSAIGMELGISVEMILVDGKAVEVIPLDTILRMLLLAFSIGFMVIGGAIPYVFQYVEIYQRKTAIGFSLFVPLALLTANILRILFWFGKQFETPLLLQSIVMIAAMLLMLEISVRMNRRAVPRLQRTSIWKGDFFTAFWRWNDLTSFIVALLLFTFVGSIVSVIFMKYTLYVEALGMIALLVEACLGLPQLIRNLTRKSTQGMSVKMVLAWLVGDVGKTLYFIFRKAPAQFYICSCLQITIDILILAQVYFYGRGRRRLPTTLSSFGSKSRTTESFTPSLTEKI